MPLELFFDLVFVLAITQCTAFMADHPSWEGILQGTLILAMLWWAWAGYAWLTSVVDPEEGFVRLAIFGAMAALLGLEVPRATVFRDGRTRELEAHALVPGWSVGSPRSGRGHPRTTEYTGTGCAFPFSSIGARSFSRGG